MRRRVLPCALLAAFSIMPALAVAADSVAGPVPPVIEKIVQRYAADNSGIIVSRQTSVYDQKAPGMNEHSEQEQSVLQQDRKTLAVRLHRVVNKGHAESAEELAKSQAALDKRYADTPPRIATRFSMPYYPESAPEYTFSAPKPCADCPAGAETVEFKSGTNDERHVHGTMTFDPATSRLIKLECVPNVLTKPMTSAKVTYTFGRHDDASWGPVRIEEHYSGRMLLISGTATRTTTVEHARHYPTLDEARRALQAG